MGQLIIKSLVRGLVVGTILFGVALFGLAVAFVEFLRPILIPGISLFRFFFQNVSGSFIWALGLVLNALIYAIFFLAILLVRKYIINRAARFVVVLLIIIVFLAATGMITDLFSLLTSPNKSWIFQIGA